MKQILVYLLVVACVVPLASSFQSRLFQLGLRRQGIHAPNTLKYPSLVQRQRAAVINSVPPHIALPPILERIGKFFGFRREGIKAPISSVLPQTEGLPPTGAALAEQVGLC